MWDRATTLHSSGLEPEWGVLVQGHNEYIRWAILAKGKCNILSKWIRADCLEAARKN